MDDVRPRGTVEVQCSGPACVDENGGWYFWVDALDLHLPNGPFLCPECESPGKHYEKAKDSNYRG